jgi:DNA-binding XRE family transcriptional regulator
MAVEVSLTRCLLRDRREAAGYTQEQLAILAGISSSRIGEYENGLIDMKLTTALKFCVIFNCSIFDLYEYEINRK